VYGEKTADDGQRNCPKHVEFYSKNKFEKSVHLVGFIVRTDMTVIISSTFLRLRAIIRQHDLLLRMNCGDNCISQQFNTGILEKNYCGCNADSI